jgi:hypothetical protein
VREGAPPVVNRRSAAATRSSRRARCEAQRNPSTAMSTSLRSGSPRR